MVGAQYRARRSILLHSEDFTASGSARKGIFAIMSPGAARKYLPDSVIDPANRPIWAIFVPDDDATVDTDTIAWDGLSLTILGIVDRRMDGTLLFKIIFAC